MTEAPIYAIGDIHGYLDQLDWALELIEQDGGPEARIVFLGDLVDRGPKSRQVIERLCTGQAEGRDWTVLRGNHDDMFQSFLQDGLLKNARTRYDVGWLDDVIGGQSTLASYGVDLSSFNTQKIRQQALQNVPFRHLQFLQSLPYFYRFGRYLFVHAGVRPEVALDQQDKQDLIWIRGEFLNFPDPHPWLVVHGHTPVKTAEHCGNRINLDSGAGYGHPITAAVFEADKVWTLTANGRSLLSPAASVF